MIAHDDLVSAFRHFARNKLRTGLAVFGIAASVASIIVMVGVADAMRRDKMSYFEEAGARTSQIVVLDKRGLDMVKEQPHRYGSGSYFRYDALEYRPIKDWRDAERLRAACPDTVAAISPFVFNGDHAGAAMSCGEIEDSTRVFGVSHDFFNCIAPKVVGGRPISAEDMEKGSRVAVLSWEIQHGHIAATLGGRSDPEAGYKKLAEMYGAGYSYDDLPMPLLEDGGPFRLNGIEYDVVGLVPPARPVLETFFRWNWCAFVPYPLERELTQRGAANRFLFYPKGTPEEAFAELKPLIEGMYPGSTAVMHSAEAWAEQERRSLNATTTGFVVIGVGTLLVAGMAVMNTMLVGVRERRLEIGVRKALGAGRKAIARQFTNETLALCAIGIVLGIAMAFGAAVMVEKTQNDYLIPLLKAWQDKFPHGAGAWTMEPREWDIHYGFLGLVAAVAGLATLGVALLASVLPAREAANMQAVASLRKTGAGFALRNANRLSPILRSPWLRPFTEDPERTWLAGSAMAVGVAVVVVLTSVGEYNRLRAAEWAEFVGADVINFRLWGGGEGNWKELPKLTEEFGHRLEEECPNVTKVWLECWAWDNKPSLRSAAVTIDDEAARNKHRIWGANATPPGMFDFYPGFRLKAGLDISREDVEQRNPVCLLDEHAASVLFPDGDALGNTLEINAQAFTVKGVIAQPDPYDREPWGGARIPYSFNRSILKVDGGVRLSARTLSPEMAREEIANLYEEVHGRELQERNAHFDMVGAEQAQARKEAWFQAALVMALGTGTLIVGGIGMMNTMLISMAARIGELGILRALGSTRRRVMGRFLFEAVMLSVGGGLVGIVVGLAASQYGLPLLYLIWGQDELWPTALSTHWPILALLFGVLVGVISATGPALKASFLRPAEALRYE